MSESKSVTSITGSEFETFIQGNELVFVDFWAPWCAPCRQFGVVYEKVSEKYPTVAFSKINIEDEVELAETFHVQSIPHLMVFKQGIVIYSEAGSMPESTLVELVEQGLLADVSQIRSQIDEDDKNNK